MRLLLALLITVVGLPAAAAPAAQAAARAKERAGVANENAAPAAQKKAAATKPVDREAPKEWHPAMQAELPSRQLLVQTLVGDIDGDGKDEWIAVGEPMDPTDDGVSVAFFSAAKGKTAPALLFAQRLRRPGLRRAGAVVRKVAPIGNAVIFVGAAPSEEGDSRFVGQIYGWNGKIFRPMAPERIEIRSQGGFSIEDIDPKSPGDEIIAWTYVLGEHEQLFDLHRYESMIFRYDGIRWVAPAEATRSSERFPDPAAAGRAFGAKNGDLRRQIPRVAEVP